ncbi:MAG: hypothetical protein ACFCU1_01350 [Sumerlaeia bacterium]
MSNNPLRSIVLIGLITGSLTAHPGHTHDDDFHEAYAEPIEQAHNLSAWNAVPVFKTDLVVSFGGNQRINGTMTMTPSTSHTRIDQKSGESLVWDGSNAWVSPASSNFGMARFHLLTWPYFLAVPFKIQDPGTHLEDLGLQTIDGVEYATARLTFGENVGDAPKDWYVLFTNTETNVLEGMSYIVSYGKDDNAIEESTPSSIRYHDYTTVNGVAIPQRWTFHAWDQQTQSFGALKGEAKLSNMEVLPAIPDGHFEKPADAKEDVLP